MTRPIFDSHFHILDPAFPLAEVGGYRPPVFTVDDYLERADGLGIRGGALVSGSFQAFDQTYLIESLRRLGPSFVGVTQIPADTGDGRILELDAAGIRGVRFNLRRGGSAPLEDLESLARRVHELAGWHVELYVDARELAEIGDRIASLPAVSIDHLGLRADGFEDLLRLVERGVKVKATGFGRLDFDPAPAIARIAELDPSALMFGTDLPSTRARRLFGDRDVEVLREAVGPGLAEAILCRNAEALYLARPR